MKKDIREVVKIITESFNKAKNGELTKDEIEQILIDCDMLIERVDMCMLMAAQIGDVALPTNLAITAWEKDFEYPMVKYNTFNIPGESKYDMVIDTEVVYYNLPEEAKEVEVKY